VLVRAANNPAMVACWLAATKAGAVVVNTMPMLRAGELAQIVDKAKIALALCDTRLMDELVACAKDSRFLEQVVGFDGTANHDAELDRIALTKPVRFEAVATGRDDVALLGFTSGTTGVPKATMQFHRDLLIIADGYAKDVLGVTPDDVFVGSPPLAFTFGLGGLAIFPLRFGAAATLLENASPANMVEIIETYRATISLTAPAAPCSRQWMKEPISPSLRLPSRPASSAGPGVQRLDAQDRQTDPGGIGATGMLHIFISNRLDDLAPGSTGKPVRGYEARIVDDAGEAAARRARSASPCVADRLRYLADQPAQLCARRLEPNRRFLRAGRGGLLPFCGAFGRHDHLGRLQHRRPGSGGGAAGACRRARMRRDRHTRRRPRPDRPGACRAGRRRRAGRRDHQTPAGSRQGNDCALQVSALGEIHDRPAEDPDRQDPALPTEEPRPIDKHTILQPCRLAQPKGYANGVAARAALSSSAARSAGTGKAGSSQTISSVKSARRCRTSSTCWPKPAPSRRMSCR
jgi:hypothetical protein